MFNWLKYFNSVEKPEKANKLTHDDIVGCVGKLPTQAEFIHYHANHPVIKQFDHWLQDNFLRSKGKGLAHGFILNDAQQPIVLGYVQESHDQSGREYPIAIFRQLSERQHILDALPAAYRYFFTSAEQLINQSWQSRPTIEVQYALAQLNKEIITLNKNHAENIASQVLMSTPYNQFWQQIASDNYPLVIPSADFLYTVETEIKKYSFAQLRLPIAQGAYREISISFWLRLIGVLRKDLIKAQYIFWQCGDQQQPTSMLIHFGELNEYLYQNLLGNKLNIDLVDPLQCMSPPPIEILDDYHFSPQTSLFDVIHFWANLRSLP